MCSAEAHLFLYGEGCGCEIRFIVFLKKRKKRLSSNFSANFVAVLLFRVINANKILL